MALHKMLCLLPLVAMFCLTRLITGFNPEIQMPYKAISGSSTSEIDAVGTTLRCNEQRNSLKECATECYNRSSSNTGCPGFYTDTTQNGVCHLCHPATSAEAKTSFSSGDVLYLLTTRKAIPEVSMDFENYTSNTIYGTGTEGTIIGLAASDHVTGVEGKGLYVHGGGKVRITGSGTECWTNLNHCSSGMTASIWIKPMAYSFYVISTGGSGQRGFSFYVKSTKKAEFFVRHQGKRHTTTTSLDVMLNQWLLLSGSYDGIDTVTGYFNGACATTFYFYFALVKKFKGEGGDLGGCKRHPHSVKISSVPSSFRKNWTNSGLVPHEKSCIRH